MSSVDWDSADVYDEPLLRIVTRFLLACLLKHSNLTGFINSKEKYMLLSSQNIATLNKSMSSRAVVAVNDGQEYNFEDLSCQLRVKMTA